MKKSPQVSCDNQEDGIIINRRAVDYGIFRTTYYRSYTNTETKHGQYFEEFCVPEEAKATGTIGHSRYDCLDNEDGLVGVGCKVAEHDAIVGKTIPITTTTEQENGSISKGKIVMKDASQTIECHEDGIVDNVFLSQNEHGKRMTKIRVRKTRIPEHADKLCSRGAQKTTIGLVMQPEDMPFTKDGITPDLIMNAAAILKIGLNNL